MQKTSPTLLRIGTSGIVVPGTKASFPEEFKSGSRLRYYSSIFNTLEINSSFYKIPLASTFEKWSADVTEDFKFTVKLWREITHSKQLSFDINHIKFFMEAAGRIGSKKGCLLIQFPASITASYFLQVEEILREVKKLDPDHHWHICPEFRHTSWYDEKTYRLLDRYTASIVLHDMPKSKTLTLNDKAELVYLRFHGPKGDYKGSYSEEFLHEYASLIGNWLSDGKEVYAYFNNTMGNALENAQTLEKFINPMDPIKRK